MIVRTFLIALVLASCWLFATLIAASAGFLVYLRDIHGPPLYFPYEDEPTEQELECPTTTDNLEDLIVHDIFSREQAKEIGTKHGSAVIPNVLTKEAAQELRTWVMQANAKLRPEDQVFVHEFENRYNLNLDMKEPSVQEAFKQVGEHPKLRPLLEDLMGPNPTLINANVLTSRYGANDQDLHDDATMRLPLHPDYFVHSYTLILALQDTTEDMGSTHLCPGTQLCESVQGAELEQETETCKVRANAFQGDAILYAVDLFHRGTAHVKVDGDARAYAFLTFAGTRQSKEDNRRLPLGTVLAMNWNMWGHTIDDFANVSTWRWWHSLGLFNNKKNGMRPWNAIDNCLMVFQGDDETVHMIHNDFTATEFSKLVDKAMAFFCVAACSYIAVLPLIVWATFAFFRAA
jgi:ectoine hydroxylase-related dioxygenase (phytanoyl-CoA dioxygenase family)